MEIVVYRTHDSNMNRRLNVKRRGRGEKGAGCCGFLVQNKKVKASSAVPPL
jgi:hypothetical protein